MDQSNFVHIYENLNHINGSKSFDTSSSLFLPISTPILLSFKFILSLSSGIGDK